VKFLGVKLLRFLFSALLCLKCTGFKWVHFSERTRFDGIQTTNFVMLTNLKLKEYKQS